MKNTPVYIMIIIGHLYYDLFRVMYVCTELHGVYLWQNYFKIYHTCHFMAIRIDIDEVVNSYLFIVVCLFLTGELYCNFRDKNNTQWFDDSAGFVVYLLSYACT